MITVHCRVSVADCRLTSFLVCSAIHWKQQNPTRYLLEIKGTKRARPPSIESGQAFDLKMIEGLLYDLYVTLHPQDCDAVLYEESEAA